MVSFQHFNFHSNQLTPIILIKTIGGSLYYTLNKKIALYIAFKTAEKVAFCYQLPQTPRVHACMHTYRQKSFHASIDTHWGIQWKRKSIIKPLNRSFPKLTSFSVELSLAWLTCWMDSFSFLIENYRQTMDDSA